MKRSTNVIVSNLSGDKILFSTFYTGLFLLFGKKTGGPSPCYGTAYLNLARIESGSCAIALKFLFIWGEAVEGKSC